MAPLGARRLVAGQVAVPNPGEVVIAAICSLSCGCPLLRADHRGVTVARALWGKGSCRCAAGAEPPWPPPTNACSGIQSEQVFGVKDFIEQVFAPNT
jgi:hypothetical protein